MQVIGNYRDNGFALARGLVPAEVAQAFLHEVKAETSGLPISLEDAADRSGLLRRAAFEFHGNEHKAARHFLWGLTPAISAIVGEDILPTYCYFRVYRRGDTCRVHSDRVACEHSVSLTLACSDGLPWALDVSHCRDDDNTATTEDFGGDPYSALAMVAGDAAIYMGASYPHGRIAPNPNRWSAHLFLHYVNRNGEYAAEAFDRRFEPGDVDFEFC